MNKPITNVSLQFPCTEDWNKMDTSSGERICSRCQHKVIDFTDMDHEEFQKHLQSSEQVCGRFKRSQLSSAFLKYAAVTLIAGSTIASTSCDPVEPVQVETIPTIEVTEETVEFVTVGIPEPPVLGGIGNYVPVIVPDEEVNRNEDERRNE